MHGAVGHTFNEPTAEAFGTITAETARRGITALLLTDERLLLQEWLGGGLILIAAYFAAHAHVKEHA